MKICQPLSLLIILSFSLCSCCLDNHRLQLKNNTNRAFYYCLLTDTTHLKKGLHIYKIKARDTVRPLFTRGGDSEWNYRINTESHDSTLTIYLFDITRIDSNKLPQQIIAQRKYKLLRFKVKELDSLKWKVEIPEQDASLFN